MEPSMKGDGGGDGEKKNKNNKPMGFVFMWRAG